MASTRKFDDAIIQRFPFKSPIIKYILDNITHKHLHKLYQTCKFFPNKFPLIIYREIQRSVYKEQDSKNYNKFLSNNDSKIWVVNEIESRGFRKNFPLLISKIWICTIKKLSVSHGMLINEFKLLTQNGSIECLDIKNVEDENGNSLSVEDIIASVPNAHDISLYNAEITSQTFTKLASLKRNVKLSEFGLGGVITEMVNSDDVLNFIEIHASEIQSRFSLYFTTAQISEEEVNRFSSDVKCKIFFNKKFQNFHLRPYFYSTVAPHFL